MTAHNPVRGALLVSSAALMFASMGGLVRLASADMSNRQVVFFRNLFGLLVLVPIVWQRRRSFALRSAHPGLLVARSLFGLAAMYCFFYALSVLPLADAVLLNFTAPLFIPFVAMLWLGEPVSPRIWVAIVLGFAGVLFILRPGGGLYHGAALIGLSSGAFAAVAMVSLRKLSATEPPLRVVVYYGAICTLVSAIMVVPGWRTVEPRLLAILAAAGGFATLGQYLLSRGYGCAPAAQIGPFTYTSVVFAAAYGWLFWQEVPGWATAAGTLLVFVAAVLATRHRPAQEVS